MIHEIRTYNLKLGQLNEYWERFGEKLPGRQKLSHLGGHWYTEVGPLNQMVAIWPYESLAQRAEIRRAAEAGPNPVWPPRYERSHCVDGLRDFSACSVYGTLGRQRHWTDI